MNRASAAITSVIVVAADSGTDLIECARRVLASTVPVELIVSDNASRDGSIEKLRGDFGSDARLRILHNGTNLGFGAGCNRAAAAALGERLLFLNPDCRLEPLALNQLCAVAASDESVGVVGARIVDAAGTPEPASRRRDPLLRPALMTMSGLARFQQRWPRFAGVNLPPAADLPEIETVDAVSGALMLLPRAAFARVGGFDEGYFLHCEDQDLCRRVRDAGLHVVCANRVCVVHAKGTSSRSRPWFVARHKHRGMWRWFTKFDPAARNPVLRIVVWCGIWTHFALMTPVYAWRWLRARF